MNRQLWLDSLKETATPSVDECIEYLGDVFPLLLQFRDTPQDPVWHAEGDVHIHTDMVLNELYQIFITEQFIPTPEERQILILAALLHDIAKPITTYTCEETGRVKASKHEDIGLNYLTLKILDLNLPQESVVQILRLVGLHQKPKLLVVKNAPRHEYLLLANDVDYNLIYWLEVADMKGRVCEDLDVQLMYLDEFLRITEEELSRPFRYHLSTNHSKDAVKSELYYHDKVGRYLLNHGEVQSLDEAHLKLFAPAKNHGTFTMLVGISGTGKSTYIQHNYPNHYVVCLDKLRYTINQGPRNKVEGQVIQHAKKLLKYALAYRAQVVFDATNLRQELRAQWLELARDYGALTTIDVLLKPEKQIRLQNKQRSAEVPEEVLTRQIEKLQLPSNNEASVVNFHIFN